VRLLNAAQLAHHLGVTRAWVYEHAAQLAAIRLGDGPRARLRFDPDTATRALQAHNTKQLATPDQPLTGRRPGRPRRNPPSTVPLLPIHDPHARSILARVAAPFFRETHSPRALNSRSGAGHHTWWR
jgi:hypothetical protein